jgi:AraC-like DNA-binding protein
MISRVFTKNKGDFFLGLVVFMLAIELFFSWGARSGINNIPRIFPYWMLLNYLMIPPSIWLFVNYKADDNFQFKTLHLWLFLPALIAYILDVWSKLASDSLIQYPAWIWFSQYLPLVGLVFVLGYFWIKYFQINPIHNFKFGRKRFLAHLKLIMLMSCLSIVCILWLTFEIIGFRHFELIEYTFIFLFLGFAFLNFMESKTFPPMAMEDKNRKFPNYDDEKNLAILKKSMLENQSYLKPNFPLKELALELNLPARYISFLINYYHKKNYKEYVNQFRIDVFLQKVMSGEHESKTLLGLALDSGFSSKSTFNQVFKSHMGKSPSEYISKSEFL